MSDQKPQDDLMNRIDEATADHDGQEASDPTGIEKRLRLLFPGHTFWKKESGLPKPIRQLVEHLGADVIGLPQVPDQLGAIWSEPRGVWMVYVRPCVGNTDVYHLKVDGPETEIEREHLTEDQVVDLLTAVGAIKS